MKRPVDISLQPGQPFNPYRMFTGIFVPEGLARCPWISAGAKLAFARLSRYAGDNGQCYPTVKALAAEIGVGERQAQKYLAELEKANLIRRVVRFAAGAQTSNAFEFLWHELFVRQVSGEGGERSFTPGVNDDSLPPVNDRSPKESHSEEKNTDLDCPATNRKKRDSQPGIGSSRCKQYPRLREALADYMMSESTDERILPKDRHVVDVVDSAGGATEDEILQCLHYLRNERGLRYGSRNGPRHFSWFATVVGDYFRQKREREEAANPVGYHAWAERNESHGIQSEPPF